MSRRLYESALLAVYVACAYGVLCQAWMLIGAERVCDPRPGWSRWVMLYGLAGVGALSRSLAELSRAGLPEGKGVRDA